MWRYTSLRTPSRSLIFVGTADVSWREQEPATPLHKCYHDYWLTILKEAMELVREDACGEDLDVVILRTNIRKLAAFVDKDLDVRPRRGMRVASEIQDLLALRRSDTRERSGVRQTPWELCYLLFELNEQEIVPWLASLNEETKN